MHNEHVLMLMCLMSTICRCSFAGNYQSHIITIDVCTPPSSLSFNEFVMLKCNNKMYEKWTPFSSGSFACLNCAMLYVVSVCIVIMINHFIVIYCLLLHANRLAINTVADNLMLIFLHLHCFVANGLSHRNTCALRNDRRLDENQFLLNDWSIPFARIVIFIFYIPIKIKLIFLRRFVGRHSTHSNTHYGRNIAVNDTYGKVLIRFIGVYIIQPSMDATIQFMVTKFICLGYDFLSIVHHICLLCSCDAEKFIDKIEILPNKANDVSVLHGNSNHIFYFNAFGAVN